MLTREQLTEKIVANKIKKGVTWAALADKAGLSREWATAALLGQCQLTKEEAATLAGELDLDADDIALLQTCAYRGALGEAVPTDPLVYRLYEIVQCYGTVIKELIHEEFGDGIMSAIDYNMSIERVPNPAGDRVKITLDGKFLPYKKF